jgi:tRNA-dihydrouridine synthase A
MKNNLKETVSLAPMVSHTTRYARYFYHLLAPDMVLYTEMITSCALIRNSNLQQIKRFDTGSSVCQLAGNNAPDLLHAIAIAGEHKYQEINLNLGCPSKQVQNNNIGVCMMKQPQLVADIFNELADNTDMPLSIKCRTGVDNLDSYEYLYNFIDLISTAGCNKFIIHARKAWLDGLNPKQNRTKPPIDYQRVYQLKQDFPQLQIIINGDTTSYEQVQLHLQQVDGVMLGRSLIDNPLLALELQNKLFGSHKVDLYQLLNKYLNSDLYLQDTHHLSSVFLLKHLFGLASFKPGAKKWRQFITEQMQQAKINAQLIIDTACELNLIAANS